jgi:hypothetical protein
VRPLVDPEALRSDASNDKGGNMRRIFGFALLLTGALVLSAGISLAGASNKFAYTEAVTSTANLEVSFEEGSMKKFDAVEYRLDATASAFYTNLAAQYFPTVSTTAAPDSRGRVSATLTTTLDLGAPSDGTCGCGLQRVEYSDVTLTNVTTGHVYRLDSISQSYP